MVERYNNSHCNQNPVEERNLYDYLLDCYADLPPREAALAFGYDYDLERDDALWPRLGLERKS